MIEISKISQSLIIFFSVLRCPPTPDLLTESQLFAVYFSSMLGNKSTPEAVKRGEGMSGKELDPPGVGSTSGAA